MDKNNKEKLNILAYKIYLKLFYLLKKIEENLGKTTKQHTERALEEEIDYLKMKIELRPSIIGGGPTPDFEGNLA